MPRTPLYEASGLEFSPGGRRLATASRNRTVKVWDATLGQEILTLRGHMAAVHGVAWSKGSERLASASEDGTVRLWEGVP